MDVITQQPTDSPPRPSSPPPSSTPSPPLPVASKMYLSTLMIEGYKCFRDAFEITFQKGLNVLVGENASGKTAVIDSVRLLLMEDDFGRSPLDDTDFNRPFDSPKQVAKEFRIHGVFIELSDEERVAFLPWTDLNGNATLTLLVENKQNQRGRYKRVHWGGASRASMFEPELFDAIDCIYLPPLRDAESKLREGKSSRLARLLKNLCRNAKKEADLKGENLPIVDRIIKFNKELATDSDEAIKKANKLIQDRLIEALGNVFGQDTQIQFAEVNFNRIVESLKLLFFPSIYDGSLEREFRSLTENSLGYNNLLYLATVLAELTDDADSSVGYKVLLIEEPEAHLHPQLQIRLLKYLEKTATEKQVQIIVTTHSPVLASSVSVDRLIHISSTQKTNHCAVSIKHCGLSSESKNFVNRWLDITKSTLLFARGVILVEGIAEAMLLPELAKVALKQFNERIKGESHHLPINLEDAGVAVININGIYFQHFMQLFADVKEGTSQNIPIRCAGITDKDPPKGKNPTPSFVIAGENPALELMASINRSEWGRLYAGDLKTFEYDLAMEANNIRVLAQVLYENWVTDGPVKKEIAEILYEDKANNKFKDWGVEAEDTKADAAYKLLCRIEDNNMGKGLFAQLLADHLIKNMSKEITIPKYIANAVIWACGSNPDER